MKRIASPDKINDFVKSDDFRKNAVDFLNKFGGAVYHQDETCGGEALILAARYGYKDLVALLLENGADINWRGTHGKTALAYAVVGNHPDIVGFLLKKGADVDLPDVEDRTPFMHAARFGDAKIIELLVENGASVELQDNRGKNASHFAQVVSKNPAVIAVVAKLIKAKELAIEFADFSNGLKEDMPAPKRIQPSRLPKP